MDTSNTDQNWQMHYKSEDNQHSSASFRDFVFQVFLALRDGGKQVKTKRCFSTAFSKIKVSQLKF